MTDASDGLLSDEDVGIGSSAAAPADSGLLSDSDVGIGGSSSPQTSTAESVAASPLVGANSLLKTAISLPGDALSWGLSKIPGATQYLGIRPGAGSRSATDEMGALDVDPSSANHLPRSGLEKVLQGAGGGAASAILPEAALGTMGRAGIELAPKVGEFLESAFGSASTPAAAAKSAAIGASSGAAGQAAGDLFPEGSNWQKGANLAGSLVGGGLGAVATEVNPWNAVKSFKAPLQAEGQEQLAGQTLRSSANSPAAAIDTIENEPHQLVPGSNPTTFQLTGDTGFGALERTTSTQDPAAFNDLRAQQNQARVDALSNIQPTGSPEDVSTALRARLNALSEQAEAKTGAATQSAQQAAAGLGGEQSPGFYGEQIRGQVQPQLDAATQDAAAQTNALGGIEAPEVYGAALREPLQAAKQSAQSARSALYRAIDPDNSLNVVASPLRDAAAAVSDRLSPLAQPPAGEEAAILGQMKGLPDVVPFNDLQALDSRITAAMSAERRSAGETPVWGRLTQMKGAVQDAIDNGISNQVAFERSQVANGALAPQNAMEARLQAEADAFQQQARASAVGANPSTNYPANSRGRSPGVPGANRTEVQGRGGFSNASGDPGVSPAARTPNFDPAAAERLAAAKQGHAAYAQTFKQGPVGNALKTNGFAGQFKSPNAAVPDTIFAKGPKGYDNAMAFRQAVGNDPAAISAAHNYAAMTLRRVAERPDGTLDPSRFSSWRASYQDALRAFPGLASKFASVAHASQELSRFEPYRADMAPFQVPEVFFHSGPGGGEAVNNLRRLVGDDRAQSVLSDYAASKLKASAMRPDGTLDPAKVAAFQKSHAQALHSFPALRDQFSSAARASETVNAVAAKNKQSIDNFQKGAIGKVMNAAPEDVTKNIGSVFGQVNAAGQMARLANEAKRAGPSAVEGLRKAIADHINANFVSNTEAGTSGTDLMKSDPFQTFMRTARPALAKVFSPEELDGMNAMAKDLHRANRSVVATRLAGASNTAQDLTAVKAIEHKPEGSLLSALIVGAGVGHEAGGIHGATLGALAGIAKHVIGHARAAGYTKVDELVRDAMLDPELAARLMRKAPVVAPRSNAPLLGQKLLRVGTQAAVNQASGSSVVRSAQQQPLGAEVPNRAAGGIVGSHSWTGGGPFFSGPFMKDGGGGAEKPPFATGGRVTELPARLRRAAGRATR